MSKIILSLAALVSSFALLLNAMPVSQAHSLPTGMSSNGYAYESFTGRTMGTPATLLTVPGDRAFVVTTIISSINSGDYTNLDLLEDGTLKFDGSSYGAGYNSGTVFQQGNAHLYFAPGSNLILDPATEYLNYYIEGYYVAP